MSEPTSLDDLLTMEPPPPMNIYKLIQPCDAITFVGNDDILAAIAILWLGEGKYGLRKIVKGGSDEDVLPLMMFASEENLKGWLADRKIDKLGEYLAAHKKEVAAFYRTVLYGDARDRVAFDASVKALIIGSVPSLIPNKAVHDAAMAWNEARRGSMNDIGGACLAYADQLDPLGAKVKEKK